MRLKQLFLVLLLSILAVTVLTKASNGKGETIFSDGRGYYAYLPSLFIYANLTFQESSKVEFQNQTYNPNYLHKTEDGHVFNKYYPGVAVMQTPFFWIAQLHCAILDIDDTGYNWVHDFWVSVGYLFYTLLGSLLLYKLLGSFSTNKTARILTILLIFVGTVLLYNAFKRPSFSHGISFFLITSFCLHFINTLKTPKVGNFVLFGVLLGLIVLVRPLNVIILLAIPIFLDTKERARHFFNICKDKWKLLLLSILSFIVVLCILFTISYIQTGAPFNWSYKGEGFNFLNPHVFELWFGFRIGVFIHLPFLLLFFAGLLLIRSKQLSFSILLYLLFITYVFSCWWCWDYGGNLGNRVFVDYYFVFAIPILFVVEKMLTNKILFLVPLALCLFHWSRLYQLHHQIIGHRFTAETYFKSVGKISKNYKNAFVFTEEFSLLNKAEEPKVLLNKKKEVKFDANKWYGVEANYRLKPNESNFYLDVRLEKKLNTTGDFRDVLLIVDARNEKGETEVYRYYPLYNYCFEGKDEWVDTRITQNLIYEMCNVESLKIYIWNKSKQSFSVKNALINLYPYTD